MSHSFPVSLVLEHVAVGDQVLIEPQVQDVLLAVYLDSNRHVLMMRTRLKWYIISLKIDHNKVGKR
jgi:hypothetical protein